MGHGGTGQEQVALSSLEKAVLSNAIALHLEVLESLEAGVEVGAGPTLLCRTDAHDGYGHEAGVSETSGVSGRVG